jgi:membrane protein insertase Oxa1/YidC/SpoIIIJ
MSAYQRLKESNSRYYQEFIQASATHFFHPNLPVDKGFYIVKFYHDHNHIIDNLEKLIKQNMLGETLYMGAEDENEVVSNYNDETVDITYFTLYMRPYEQDMVKFAANIHYLFGHSFGMKILTKEEFEKIKKG